MKQKIIKKRSFQSVFRLQGMYSSAAGVIISEKKENNEDVWWGFLQRLRTL